MTFNGSFRSACDPAGEGWPDGAISVLSYVLLPAPNRYRKLFNKDFAAPNPASPDLSGAFSGAFDADKAVEMMKSDFPELKNPIGLEFDLFETYICWDNGG